MCRRSVGSAMRPIRSKAGRWRGVIGCYVLALRSDGSGRLHDSTQTSDSPTTLHHSGHQTAPTPWPGALVAKPRHPPSCIGKAPAVFPRPCALSASFWRSGRASLCISISRRIVRPPGIAWLRQRGAPGANHPTPGMADFGATSTRINCACEASRLALARRANRWPPHRGWGTWSGTPSTLGSAPTPCSSERLAQGSYAESVPLARLRSAPPARPGLVLRAWTSAAQRCATAANERLPPRRTRNTTDHCAPPRSWSAWKSIKLGREAVAIRTAEPVISAGGRQCFDEPCQPWSRPGQGRGALAPSVPR